MSKSYWKCLLGAAGLFAGLAGGGVANAFEPTELEYWETPEYFASLALRPLRAAYGYLYGFDGTGVVVGLVDSGIDPNHPEFAGQIVGGYDFVANSPILRDYNGHGTGVGALIVGLRDGVGMQGIAPGAKIMPAAIFGADGFTNDYRITAAWDYLLDNGVRIINNSWGTFDAHITDYTAADYLALRPEFVAAARDAVARDGLIVFVTQNGSQTEVNTNAGLPYLFPELERGWLAVTGSVDYDGIANWCGVAMNWCLAAPANQLITADPGGGYGEHSGTSFAAPLVAGAAAMVWQEYPWLTTDQVRQVLLGTAWDIGDPGVDARYGYGQLDVAMALGGPGKFDWGDFRADVPTGAWGFGNDITGAGGLVKVGPGALVLFGQSSYDGDTRAEAGTLAIAGSVTSDTFVGPAAALTGDGWLWGSLSNEGKLLPGIGQHGGTMTVAGDFTQSAHGTFQVLFNGEFGTSNLVVGQTANLAGALQLELAPGTFSGTQTQAILTAGAVSGTFDSLIERFAFLDASVTYQPQDVSVTLFRNGTSFASAAGSANGAAAAAAIEALGSGNALYDSVVSFRSGQAADAFDQLSGSEYADLPAVSIGASALVANGANARLRSAFNSAGAVESPVMAYAPSATPIFVSEDYQAPAFWTSAQGSWSSGGALESFSGGQLIGVDAPVGGWTLGALAGFGKSSASSASANVDSTDYHVGLYGGTQWNAVNLRAGASLSRQGISTERSVTALGQTLTGSYGALTAQSFAEIGYGLDAGSFRFEPFAGLSLTNVWTDGFAEAGGSAALSSGPTSTLSAFATLGINADMQIVLGATPATVRAGAGWRHALLDDRPIATNSFAGGGSFDVVGQPVAKDTALVEGGLDLPIGDAATFGVTYGGQFSEQARSHGVKAELRVQF